MSAAYTKGITLALPNAQISYDRFHVVALANAAMDEVRREEMRTSAAATISRWVCPDVMRNHDISVAKAKKAADYKKAIGRPEGLAELSVYYCEEVFTFPGYCGMDDGGYYSALVRMFEQALKSTMALPEPQCDDFLDRLEAVRVAGQDFGWGVGDDFNWLWQKAGLEIDT